MNRLSNRLRPLFAVLATCLALLVHPTAWAQPTVGAVFQNVLPLGGGSSVPLPPGKWKSTHTAEVPDGAYKWKAYVLTNQDPQSPVAAVVVRNLDARVSWGATPCDNPAAASNSNSFMVNAHGTQSSQLVNKCSRVSPIGTVAGWRAVPSVRSSAWWKDLWPGLDAFDQNDERRFFVVEARIQQFNGPGLYYDLFVQPPQGKTPGQIRDEYRAGTITTEHRLLEGWIAVLMESMQQSYLVKRVQPALVALGYKIHGGVGGQTVTPPSVSSVLQDSLPLGSASRVPLPPGKWKVTQTAEVPDGSAKWKSYVLTNQDPQSQVVAVVIRNAEGPIRWGGTNCDNPSAAYNANAFMINLHGTEPHELVNKCSRVLASGNLAAWRDHPDIQANKWWKDLRSGLNGFSLTDERQVFRLEMHLQQFDGPGLRYELFVESPVGKTPVQFRDAYRSGNSTLEHKAFETWVSALMDGMHQSFLENKPRPAFTALGYTTRGSTMTVAQASAAQVAAPVKPVAATTASPSTPVNTTASVLANASPAQQLVAAPKPAASPAADAEARELRQQLEKMQQMIAQLQAANAASAKAAALAAEQSAVVAAPVSKQPAAKPILANRKALIIGNDLYTDVPKLSNAAADADAMAKSLEQVGFQVFKHLNVNEKGFKQALRDFRLKVRGGDEVLFFFAGHGVQLGAANYLLPTDIKGDHEEQVKDEAIQLQKVLDDLQDKKTKFALAVVDACRDNPFKGQGRAIGGRGLAPTTAATGQMIIFSAGSGQQALDKLGPADKDRNGLFTRIFVKEMLKPGVSVDRVLRNVRNEVVRLAQGVGHEQTPALYDQAVGEFFFLQ